MIRWPEDPVLKPVHDADPDGFHAEYVPGCDYCDYHWPLPTEATQPTPAEETS